MRIFSGIQPTGSLHIGNYLGAIKQWLDLQHENECIFCIVDFHAITTPYDKENFRKEILNQATSYLAAGLDPEKVIIFVQSRIKEHTELCWILNTLTPLGELYRMTQYKEKAEKYKKNENAGLLNYPLLMAADILLYSTETVPVGEDQRQHVELTREVARRFNKEYGETFVLPKEKLPEKGARIMSLSDPTKKMSKSDGEESFISLFDEPEDIRKKLKSAVTDAGKTIKYDPKKKPGVSNLLAIHSLLSEKPIKEIEKEMKEKGYKDLKEETGEVIVNELESFRKKREKLSSREVYVEEILKQGERKARSLAESKMAEVRRKMGVW